MAITKKIFKPSFLYTYQGGSYRNSNSPVKSAGSPAYTSIVGFPQSAINAIKESKTSAKIYVKWRVTNGGTVAFGAHKKASNDKQPNIYYTYIGIERTVPTGWYTQEITNATLTNGGYGFKTALLSHGYKGFVMYGQSGQNYMEGYGITSDSNSMQIIIEGTFTDEPTEPTNMKPSVGSTLDPSSPALFSWKHNGTGNAKTQNGYRIAYRTKPSGAWNYVPSSTGFVNSASQSHTFAGGTFSLGSYEWRVKTRATNGQESPYGAYTPFNVTSIASAPTINAPEEGQVITNDLLYVNWTSVEQAIYYVILEDENGEVYSESEAGTTNSTFIAGMMEDNKTYTVKVFIQNEDGAMSSISSVTFTTQFTRPEKPTINSITTVDGTQHIVNYSTVDNVAFVNPDAPNAKMDFVGKIENSLVENPHVNLYGWSTSLTSPTTGTENETIYYEKISTLDGQLDSFTPAPTAGNLVQVKFRMNIVEHIERNYGELAFATIAEKITFIKANITSFNIFYYGRGSGSAGASLTLYVWNGTTWQSLGTNMTSTVSLVQGSVTLAGSSYIDADGYITINAVGGASSASVSSSVSTDYVYATITPSGSFVANAYGSATVAYANVYSRKYTVGGTEDWKKIGNKVESGLGKEFVNYRFPSNVTMEYKVEAVTTTGSTNTSDVSEYSTTFSYAYLSLNNDLSNMIALTINESRDEEFELEQALMKFIGRRSPVPEFGVSEETSINLKAFFETYEEALLIKGLSRFRKPLYYRDYSGREMVCVIDGAVKITDLIAGGYEVDFTITEIDAGGIV